MKLVNFRKAMQKYYLFLKTDQYGNTLNMTSQFHSLHWQTASYRRLPECYLTIFKVVETIVVQHQDDSISVQDNSVT